MNKGWIYLSIAILAEIFWASTLKTTEEFTQLWPSILCLTALSLSVFFLSITFKYLPMSKAYPIWVGFGGIGVLINSILFFHESINLMQIIGISLIIFGSTGLDLFKSKPKGEDVESEQPIAVDKTNETVSE